MSADQLLFAVILCGGRSRRMGQDKASVEFAGKPLLLHIAAVVCDVAERVVVVGAADQQLPQLPSTVDVVTDVSPFPGPLPALQTGLQHLQDRHPEQIHHQSCVWVTGCDTPFLTASIIRFLHGRLQCSSADVVTLTENGRRNPLLSLYRLHVAGALGKFVSAGGERATEFLDQLDVLEQPIVDLPFTGSQPSPALNLNTPEDLREAKQYF